MRTIAMIRKCKKKIMDTAKVIIAKQVSLDHRFPVFDPGHRRAVHAPMMIR